MSRSAQESDALPAVVRDVLKLISDGARDEVHHDKHFDDDARGASSNFWARFCNHAQEEGRVEPTCVIDFAFSDGGRLRGGDRLLERLYAFSDVRSDSQTHRVVLHVHTLMSWKEALRLDERERAKKVTAVNVRVMAHGPASTKEFHTNSPQRLLPRSQVLREQWRELHQKGRGHSISWSWQHVPSSVPALDSSALSEYRKVAKFIEMGEELLKEQGVDVSKSMQHSGELMRGGVEEDFIVVAHRHPVDLSAAAAGSKEGGGGFGADDVEEPAHGTQAPDPPPDRITVLFVGANNSDAVQLKLKEESSQMRTYFMLTLGSEAMKRRAQFLPDCFTSADELMMKIREEAPTVLHFGCHGDSESLRLFRSSADKKALIEAVRTHQARHPDKIRLAVLNACMSDDLARGLSESVDFVIGHRRELADSVALSFTKELYHCLGGGKLSLKESFENAKLAGQGRSGGHFLYAPRVDPGQFFPLSAFYLPSPHPPSPHPSQPSPTPPHLSSPAFSPAASHPPSPWPSSPVVPDDGAHASTPPAASSLPPSSPPLAASTAADGVLHLAAGVHQMSVKGPEGTPAPASPPSAQGPQSAVATEQSAVTTKHPDAEPATGASAAASGEVRKGGTSKREFQSTALQQCTLHDIPGITNVAATKLKEAGVDSAEKLIGKFLVCSRDVRKTAAWLERDVGVRAQDAAKVCAALRDKATALVLY